MMIGRSGQLEVGALVRLLMLGGAVMVAVVVLNAGCQGVKPSGGTMAAKSGGAPGRVKQRIVVGETTQAEVMEMFGSPDLLQRSDELEVWTYERTSFVYEAGSGELMVIDPGGGTRRQGVGGARRSMLIVYFDERDVVSDYRLSDE